ncbi:hypothetical protein M3J09_004622 [Ascochyta lentis]
MFCMQKARTLLLVSPAMKPHRNLGEVWALLGLARNATSVCHLLQTKPRPCPPPRNLWLAMANWCLFDGDKSAKRRGGFWARHRTSERVMQLPVKTFPKCRFLLYGGVVKVLVCGLSS